MQICAILIFLLQVCPERADIKALTHDDLNTFMSQCYKEQTE